MTLDVDDLDDLARLNPATGFAPFQAYARAKLLTVIAGRGLAHSLAREVTINAVHPGIVATGIISGVVPGPLQLVEPLIRRAMLTPEQGAAPALRLALDPDQQGVTGRYFVGDTVVPTPPITSRPRRSAAPSQRNRPVHRPSASEGRLISAAHPVIATRGSPRELTDREGAVRNTERLTR